MRSKRPAAKRGGRIALAWISAICLLGVSLAGPSAASARAAAVSKQVKVLRKQVRALKLQLRRLNRRVGSVAKQRGPAGPAGPAGLSTGPAGGALSGSFPNPSIANGAVGTAAIADGSLLGADLAPETVGPPQILDRIRTVDLPLSSFVGPTSPIDFGPDDGTGVNLAYTPEPLEELLALEWDDDSDLGGPDMADTGAVQTSFTVPADYASGGVARAARGEGR